MRGLSGVIVAGNCDLPWIRINDYLAEIGAVENINEFCHRVLVGLVELVPFDNNAVFVVSDKTGFSSHATFVESVKWSELYNNYYWRLQPEEPEVKVVISDWIHLPATEYITDFLFPQGIGSTISISRIGSNNGLKGGLALHRSKNSSCFIQQDMSILSVIEPHLSNYFAIHALLSAYGNQLPDAAVIASDHKCLTRREAEIAALLCHRFSTGMIASRLLISNLTVYRHIANIFEKLKVFNRNELIEKLSSRCFEKRQ